MNRPCRDLETSLGRPAHTLSEAERLRLEQHLTACAACRRESDLARNITQLVLAAPSMLSESSRERAIAASFARATSEEARRASTHWLRSTGIAVAAAAMLALGLRFAHQGNDDAALAVASKAVGSQAAPSVAEPPASMAAAAMPTAPAPDQWLDVDTAETRRFAHAQVTLDAHARVRFDAASSTLELARGRASIDVDASKGAPFAVQTSTFRVQVLGTQFVVTPESVEVLRGRVAITHNRDTAHVRKLGPGETYRPSEGVRAHVSHVAPRQVVGTAELLRQAHRALAQGEPATARGLIERAQQSATKRSERAEAGTLSAECSMLEQKPVEAQRAYLAVAERYGALPAGENALFAAAQLSQPSDLAQARGLLESYLARYPRGRFVEEARARLRKLAR